MHQNFVKFFLLFCNSSDNEQQIFRAMTSIIETSACVWLDRNVERNWIQQELRYAIRHLRIFEVAAECDNYIRASTKEKVVLIMSDAFNQSTLTRLHDLPQLAYCYVFCRDISNNTAWTNQYQKVRDEQHCFASNCDE